MQAAARPLKICVIGAGVVGSATAQTLAQAGHEVILMDAAPAPAAQASSLPRAQLSYFDVEPLATPALLRRLGHHLLDHESPIGLHPRGGWRQLWWSLRFLRACRAPERERAIRALLALALLSRDELQSRRNHDELDLPASGRGKLTVLTDADELDAAAYQVALLNTLGCEQTLLKPAECLTLEPTLGSMKDRLLGAVWTPDEVAIDAPLLTHTLAQQTQMLGGQLRTQTRVTGFSRQGERVTAVHTDSGDLLCDAVVLANGVEAPALARKLGLHLAICPLKGHGITLPIRHAELAPTVSVADAAQRIVFTPAGKELHVSGQFDLRGQDLRRDPHRVRGLLNAAKALFPDSCEFTADPQAWTGLRAATPTGLPLIGPTRWNNVWLNVGHGALGVTLALGSARLVERWVAQDVNAELAAPFIPPR